MTELLAPVRDLDAALAQLLRVAEAGSLRGVKTKALAPLERDLARALRTAFRAQRKAFLRHLAAAGAGFPTNESLRALREAVARWDPEFDDAASDTFSLFEEPLDAALRAALLAGSVFGLGRLGLDTSFDLSNPRAAAYLDGRAAAQVKGINEVTRARLEALITAGLAEGESYTKIAGRIRTLYDTWEGGKLQKDQTFRAEMPQAHIRDRAELIAVTETAEGYEAGSRGVVDDLVAAGLSMEKSFLTASDRVCDECDENEQAGWIPVEDEFPNGDAPAHPACRCTTLYQRAQEAA